MPVGATGDRTMEPLWFEMYALRKGLTISPQREVACTGFGVGRNPEDSRLESWITTTVLFLLLALISLSVISFNAFLYFLFSVSS